MPDFFTVTVSQVTRRLSMIVKGDKALNDLYVSGEISNFTLHKASGHMYFTLKDETASIKCVMFAGNARSLDFTPYSGQSVIVHGSVNVYERDGANQIYVTDMIERGQGELALAYEQAKRELEAGGYFNKKRPIPKQPKKVCLITAEKGAALQDMLNIIARRRPILVSGFYSRNGTGSICTVNPYQSVGSGSEYRFGSDYHRQGRRFGRGLVVL